MRVFIAGGTGAIGRYLVPMLVRRGHQVAVMTRSPEKADDIARQGASPVIGDALDENRLQEVISASAPAVIVNQLTSIPRRMNPRRIAEEMTQTNRLRTEGTRALLKAAQQTGVGQFVSQSVSFLYDPAGQTLARENEPLYLDAPASFREMIQAVHTCEQQTLNTEGVNGIVLRYGFFYGPGTIYESAGSFANDVRERRIPIIGNGEGVYSFVHVDDAAFATTLAVEGGEPGIFNVVDDDPVPFYEWLPHYADLLGAPAPMRVPGVLGKLGGGPYVWFLTTQQRGASNEEAKRLLNWKPRYASWREGFRSALQI